MIHLVISLLLLKMKIFRLQVKEILDNHPKNRKLQIELVITVDVGEPFVKATYRLEGDCAFCV